jgi:hypothetical protein
MEENKKIDPKIIRAWHKDIKTWSPDRIAAEINKVITGRDFCKDWIDCIFEEAKKRTYERCNIAINDD